MMDAGALGQIIAGLGLPKETQSVEMHFKVDGDGFAYCQMLIDGKNVDLAAMIALKQTPKQTPKEGTQ